MKSRFIFALIFIPLFGLSTIGWGQTQVVHSSSTTWSTPAGVTGITVEGWGGGGSGGRTETNGRATGGGGGGAYAKSFLSVSPSTGYAISIGAGGLGTAADYNGVDTYFGDGSGLRAKGGSGVSLNNRTGGTGGTGSTYNIISMNGGTGGNGYAADNTTSAAGGGGSGAGSNGPGNTGGNGNNSSQGGAGGLAVTEFGGAGGAGVGSQGVGGTGLIYGGGGGGSKRGFIFGSSQNGGTGRSGYMRISYYLLTSISTTTPICSGSPATITINATTVNLPAGSYTVTYDLSSPNLATGLTASMTVSTAGTGTFTTSALLNSGNTTITVTHLERILSPNTLNIKGGIGANNTAIIAVNTPSTDPVSITGITAICSGSSTTLTTSGGSLGSDAEDVWYEGGCATEIFTNEWQTQPYATDGTTVNSYNGILNVTSTNGDPMIHMENIGSYNTALCSYMQIRYRVVSGTAGSVQIYYSKNGGGDLSESQVVVADLTSDNNWHVVNVNMSASPNWTGTITGWRFDWCSASGVTMDVDFITLSDRPILEVGSSVTVSPLATTTYFTRKKGACNSTSCISQVVTVTKAGATFGCPIDAGTLGCTPFTDTQNNSTANGFGNDYTGANNQPSDDIFYRFTLASTSTVEISTCASSFDSYLHLLDGTGALISENDNPGPVCQNGGAASIRQFDLAAGTYYVVVEGWGTEAGDIPLVINILPSGTTTADDYSVCSGSNVTFTYTSSGDWTFSNFQYQIDGTAGTWSDWTGASPYAWTSTDPGHAFYVRAKANNGSCDSYAAPIIVFVNPTSGAAPAITANPATINPNQPVTLSVSDESLGAYFKFASDINDYSPNGLNLTGSSPTFIEDGLRLYYSDPTSYNSLSTDILNSNNYTISFSIKVIEYWQGAYSGTIFTYAPVGFTRSPGIFFNNDGTLYWRENYSTSTADEGITSTPLEKDVWYNIMGEKNGNTLTLYINGIIDKQSIIMPDPKAPGNAELHFGGVDVIIKEFKIYPGTVRWYSGTCGGTPEGSGLSITKTPTSSVTYFVRSETSCYNSDCSSWSVNANWLGGASGDVNNWNNTANWFGGVIPVAGTDVIIPSGVDQPVISDATAAECNNLTINPGASLTIQSSVTSSGSLIVRGASVGNVTYQRQFKEYGNWGSNDNFDWHYFSSPVASNSDANASKVSAVYSYDEKTDKWPVASMTDLTPGKGYNLDQAANTASDELLTFTGPVVRSALSIEATSPYLNSFNGSTSYDGREFAPSRDNDEFYGGGGWNLLGNPFTSALDAAAFIAANDGDFDPNYKALYVYDGSVGDHGAYVINTTGAIQAGQGFFVLAMNNGVSFSFTPANATALNMQVHSTSTALLKSAKAENPWPGLELKVKYGSNESSTSILYGDAMTPGLDPGYDIGQLSTGPDVEIYTSLAKDNGVNFARQALPVAGADTIKVAVGIDSEAGGEVTFSATTVPIGGNKFWLEDRKTGTFTDLSTGTYTVTLPAKTYGTGRFYIISSANTPTGIKEPAPDDSDLRVWTSNGKVIIKGEVSEKAICEVYSVNGKQILHTRLTGGELNTIDLPSGSKGVFIVRVVDGVKLTTRKVAIL